MSQPTRLHALDAVRAFALLLGVVFHAGFSFLPGLLPGVWAMTDNSPSPAIAALLFTSHIFRMSLFFVVAGFFARMLFHDRGARGFWTNRLKRILVPLVVGWVVLFPAIAFIWVWGITKTFGGTLPPAPPEAPPSPPGAFPLTHLWFLYYLLVLYVIVVLTRTLVASVDTAGTCRRRIDMMVRRAVSSGVAAFMLPLPLVAALYLRADWVAWFGIPTPDHSLIPEVASLVGFGTAVTFGWLVHRQTELLSTWRKQWPMHLVGAVVATSVCLWTIGLTPTFAPHAQNLQKLWFALSYGIAIWCWSFAVLGAAVRFLSEPNSRVRYIADASYWIYLVHLPLVAALQVVVGRLPWHWSVKFSLMLVVSMTLLLVTYRYLVRATYVGQILNGRRYPRTLPDVRAVAAQPPAPPAAASDIGADTSDSQTASADEALATLAGVHKRYGQIVALAGLELGVRRGELLAVLGPNGAGKSTAISLWLGLLQPDAGTAQLFGGSPLDVETRRRIGVMMQEVGLTPELRVRELIELTSSYYPEPLTVNETLALTRIEALANRPYASLSAGQKRQAQFALAVCGRPALLFLDEPTVGLDVDARETMWRTIRELLSQGCSIVLTTHYLEEAEALASRIAVLAHGRLIASGTVEDIRSVVSRKHISCASGLSEDEISRWPGVIGVTRSLHRLHVTATDAEAVVRRLLAADDRVRDLEVRQAGLAEAFSALTKEAA
jgi:ABC-type multidrug transport system ATPase subunit/peptidoglycan/LPS O-acetylase OafA/YrhL